MPGDNSLPEVLVRIGAALDEWNAAPGQPYDLSASIGFAHFQKLGTDSIEEMLCRADALMYARKHQTTPG